MTKIEKLFLIILIILVNYTPDIVTPVYVFAIAFIAAMFFLTGEAGE